ncbi:1856_t:CDS:2, partial [Paraglomus occultum]
QAVLILKTEMDLVTTAHDMHNIEDQQLQRHNNGDAEDGLHARNSGILRIISVLASVELNRNITTYSTLKRKRVDAHIGDIPITLVEEKSDRCDLEVAKRELREKFAWPPHYCICNLPFIIAIAVADDVISFNKLNRSLFLMDELKVDLSLNKQETFQYSF